MAEQDEGIKIQQTDHVSRSAGFAIKIGTFKSIIYD